MGEAVKFKHFMWAIGSMLVYAFILGWNVKSKMNLVENNSRDILELKIDVKTLISTDQVPRNAYKSNQINFH